jgi:FtsP/CotA-like multicopper oxidase with cupredoxin domain
MLFQDPGANEFTYTLPLHEQTGTFWYHGHLSSQYVDGLRGPLVIYGEPSVVTLQSVPAN